MAYNSPAVTSQRIPAWDSIDGKESIVFIDNPNFGKGKRVRTSFNIPKKEEVFSQKSNTLVESLPNAYEQLATITQSIRKRRTNIT